MIDNTWTNIGVFATVLSVGITILIFIVKGSHQIGRWEKRQDSQEKATEKLEDKIKRVDNEIEQVKVELGEVKVNLKGISTKLGLIYQNTNFKPIANSHSPVSLTPLGEDIKKNINGDIIFSKYAHKLYAYVEESKTKNAYDIQIEASNIAKEHLLNMLDEQELTVIKDGAFKQGIIVDDIVTIFAIMLRDFILKNKGISTSEVNKHAPKTK